MVKEKIIVQLQKVLEEIVVEMNPAPQRSGKYPWGTSLHVDISTDISHGDFTTNVAFQLSKILKKSPMQIAQEISSKLKEKPIDGLEKIEEVNPGFINFTIAKKELIRNMMRVISDKEKIYAAIQIKDPKFEMYENTGPNTNKPLHIGHVRNITLGVSLVHLRKAIGHKVWSVNINNDRGIHIIKCIWAYLQFGQHKVTSITQAKHFVLPESFIRWNDLLKNWFSNNTPWHTPTQVDMKPDHYLGIYYMLGDRAAKEYPDTTDQMKEMLLAWENGETHVRLIWEMMNGWFYDGFRQTHARLLGISPSDTQYDKEWYESELYKAGRQIVLDNLDKGIFYRAEDTVIRANLKKYTLPDKVVIRSDGSSLYITFDLEEAREMVQDYKADLIAHVVSNEQELYFKQLFAIVDMLGIAPKEKFLHIAYGTVFLKGGAKMSSREGTVILADDLIDLVKSGIKKSFKEVSDETVEQVAIGAITYSMLKYNPKADINFDIDQSISIEGNSGPYIQYTYARTQSILRKSGIFQGSNPPWPTGHSFPCQAGELLSSASQEEITQKENIPSYGGANEVGVRVTDSNGILRSDQLLYDKVHYEIEEYRLIRQIYQFPEVVQKAAESYSPNVVCEYLFTLAQEFNLFYQKHRILDASDETDRVFRLRLTESVGGVIQEGLKLLGIAAPREM